MIIRNALAFAALTALGASACSDPSLCEDNGVTVDIVDNHPQGSHILDVTADDVLAGEEVSYDITGDNTGHGHSVVVSPDDFAALEDGEEVTLESTDLGAAGQDHTHPVILDCDP